MENQQKIQRLNDKLIKESKRFTDKVIEYQIESAMQMQKFNNDTNLLVKL